MKTLNLVTLILIIIGAINWLLVGLFDFNLVAAIFGTDSALTNLIYIIVGVSGLYQLVPFAKAIQRGEVDAEADRTGTRANR
jgi:uncharacterized membrane protein YuzA (DUF378 family)